MFESLQEWKRKGLVFQYNNLPIFYRVHQKDKPWLLLLHGFPTCSWDWYKMWPELSQHYNLITFDMIGFGLSAKPIQHQYSLFEQANLCEALLQYLNINECLVIAHDYGDTVFQELLARQNEKRLSFYMYRCVMLNGGLFHGVHRPLMTQKILMSPIGFIVARLMSQLTLNRSFKKIFGQNTQPSQIELDQFWTALTYNQGRRNIHKIIRYMEERKTYYNRWVGALQNASIPLRLIDGVDDPISGSHLCDFYEANIPCPDVIRLENIGHYPQIEDASTVLQHTLTFFNRADKVTNHIK